MGATGYGQTARSRRTLNLCSVSLAVTKNNKLLTLKRLQLLRNIFRYISSPLAAPL